MDYHSLLKRTGLATHSSSSSSSSKDPEYSPYSDYTPATRTFDPMPQSSETEVNRPAFPTTTPRKVPGFVRFGAKNNNAEGRLIVYPEQERPLLRNWIKLQESQQIFSFTGVLQIMEFKDNIQYRLYDENRSIFEQVWSQLGIPQLPESCTFRLPLKQDQQYGDYLIFKFRGIQNNEELTDSLLKFLHDSASSGQRICVRVKVNCYWGFKANNGVVMDGASFQMMNAFDV